MPRRPNENRRSSNWMFTINNPTMDHVAMLALLESNKHAKYALFQKERGADGTIHMQGYLELAKNQRLSYVRKLFKRAHWEIRKGTQQEARDYCRKKDSRIEGPWEHGLFKANKPGSRTDIQDAIDALAKHRNLSTLATTHGATFIRYHKGFAKYLQVTTPRRKEPPRVSLYFGGTGTGKTRKAFEDNEHLFRKHPDSKWFDGLGEQECLLLDDFNGASSKMSLSYVLQLLDRYDFSPEVKGDYTPLCATRIIVTTNNHPNTWYNYTSRQENYRALARRFHQVVIFEKDRSYTVDTGKFFGENSFSELPEHLWDIRKIIADFQEEESDDTIEILATISKKPVLERQNAFIDIS